MPYFAYIDHLTCETHAIKITSSYPFFILVHKETIMKLNAPKQVTFIIAVVLFIVALIAELGSVAALAVVMPWLWIVAFVLLALGVLLKDF